MNTASRIATAAFMALVVTALSPAQGEIIVDAAGGGDFTEIQPAIDAADPWQVIRVRHGSYAGATITKSVRLLGDPYQQISPNEFSFIEITSPIFIRDLPAGAGCVITDLAADPDKSQDFDDLIDARNCEGAIHLAFTQFGNIVLEDCSFVTINDHFSRGRFRAVRSTVVASNCLLREWSGPTIDLFDSDFLASFLLTGPSKDGDPAVRVDGGSSFIADFNSAIVSGGFIGADPFDIIDGTVDDKRLDSLAFNGNRGLFPTQSTDYLLFELNMPRGNIQAEAFGASLPSFPRTTPQGEFFLDPGTFELLHFGLGFSDSDVRVHLPATLKPSRYFDTSFPSRLALPGAQLQGIPVVFQGAFLIDGVAKYTLPFIIVL